MTNTYDMVPPMKPLTVIKVERHISQDEAQAIHDQFRASVPDDRPVIVVGPETDLIMLEPWALASRRAWLALLIALVALVLVTVGLIIILL